MSYLEWVRCDKRNTYRTAENFALIPENPRLWAAFSFPSWPHQVLPLFQDSKLGRTTTTTIFSSNFKLVFQDKSQRLMMLSSDAARNSDPTTFSASWPATMCHSSPKMEKRFGRAFRAISHTKRSFLYESLNGQIKPSNLTAKNSSLFYIYPMAHMKPPHASNKMGQMSLIHMGLMAMHLMGLGPKTIKGS